MIASSGRGIPGWPHIRPGWGKNPNPGGGSPYKAAARVIFERMAAGVYSYDEWDGVSVYNYDDDLNVKNPPNTGILIAYASKFQGVWGNASRQAIGNVDPQGINPCWSRAINGLSGENFARGNDAINLPWTKSIGAHTEIKFPGYLVQGRRTTVAADLIAINLWETCWAANGPAESYWTIPGPWAAGMAGLAVGPAFPSKAGDSSLYWVRAMGAQTALTWCRGEGYNILRRVVISAIGVIP